MKHTLKYISLLILMVACAWQLQAQVAVNSTGNAPDASAMLEVTSTAKGFLTPRMTKAQRDLISSPATGLLIYQTDNMPGFHFFDGSNWKSLGGGNIEPRAMINGAAPSALNLLYSGPSRTDADNTEGYQFVSDEGYYIDITVKGTLGESWIWYSNDDCTGTAYAEPKFYGPGATFASPEDGSLFYVDQAATLTNATAMSRYIVSSNTCQVFDNTQDYYPLTANNSTTTGINLSSTTVYNVTFQ